MANTPLHDIASLGILVLDIFGKQIDEFPAPGTSLFFDTMQVHPGGCAYNTGVDATRLGLDVAILGMVGEDPFGDVLIQKIVGERAHAQGVVRTAAASTSCSFVMVPGSGQRRIYTSFGANGVLSYDDVDLSIVESSRVLHIGGASMLSTLDGEQTKKLLQYAKGAGVVTCMDPVYRRDSGDVLAPCLPYLDYFLPNSDESAIITGYSDPMDQLKYYLDKGVKTAAVKLGEHGCVVSDGKVAYRLGVYSVPVLDTCGAGDAFVAGFLYGVIKRRELRECAKFASATASYCVRELGTTTAIPDAATVEAFMAEHPILVEPLSLS